MDKSHEKSVDNWETFNGLKDVTPQKMVHYSLILGPNLIRDTKELFTRYFFKNGVFSFITIYKNLTRIKVVILGKNSGCSFRSEMFFLTFI